MADPSMTPTPVDQVRKNPSPLTNGTWVLVADGEKALFLENIGDADYPQLEVRREKEQDNPKTAQQGTDRPGRFNDGPNVHRSAVEQTDWHHLEQMRFADDLAEMLYKRAHANGFKRLIIAASPKVLGELRDKMHKEVADKLVGEVALTLTNHPIDEMAKRIADHLTDD
ncbi:host attachment family protein [Roseibacterium beibuensis]|nr:host attachment family protein [Roseibacterium beibuensis]MCS6621333.1 host attachment family protein [Roseibacterium beibuensis]